MVDDLNAPPGQDKQKRLPNLPVSAPQLLAGALGLSGVVVVAWAAFVNDPLGGEPIAVVATKVAPTSVSSGQRQGWQAAFPPRRHNLLATRCFGARGEA
ncbi:MAG TPA: hypothetical protein VIY07_04765 [Pseudolabrys sp.]